MSWICTAAGGGVVGGVVGGGVGPPLPPEFCGVGAPAVKSAALSSVSVSAALRATEAELLAPAAGPLPSWTTAVP